jgi:DNA-binding GntR family transcriptional regulator
MGSLPLKEQAYTKLKKLILSGEIKTGELITERVLVESLEMSRTPIRSALEKLEAEGFVKQSPKQGILVLELSINRAIDIYNLRIAVESFIVRKLSESGFSEQQMEWFETNLEQQKIAMHIMDYESYTEADASFHRGLALAYENTEMMSIMDKIQDKLYQIAIKVVKKDQQRMKVSYQDHLNIFNYIKEGKAEEAAHEMIQHLEFGKRILIS